MGLLPALRVAVNDSVRNHRERPTLEAELTAGDDRGGAIARTFHVEEGYLLAVGGVEPPTGTIDYDFGHVPAKRQSVCRAPGSAQRLRT